MCCNRCLLSFYDLPRATATVAIRRAGGADSIPSATAAGTMTAGIEVRAAAVMVLKVHPVANLHISMSIHTLDCPLATATVAIRRAGGGDRILVATAATIMTAGIEVRAAVVLIVDIHGVAVLHGGILTVHTGDTPLATATVAIRIVAGFDVILSVTAATTVTTGI